MATSSSSRRLEVLAGHLPRPFPPSATGGEGSKKSEGNEQCAARSPIRRRVIVVGAGLSGLMASVELLDKGIVGASSGGGDDEDLVIFEKGPDVGGTWFWNRYPGCACDVPSIAYLPFLHRTKYVPSKKYVSGGEIQQHLSRCAEELGVADRTHFNTRVVSACFNEDTALWRVETRREARQDGGHGDNVSGESDGSGRGGAARSCVWEAPFLIIGVGPLSTPHFPEIPGLDVFKAAGGAVMHTANWDSTVPLEGMRVGVVGTGATAVQVVPEIAKVAQTVTVFQRTAAWCTAREDAPTTDAVAAALTKDTAHEDGVNMAFNTANDTYNDFINDAAKNARLQRKLERTLRAQVHDPKVAAMLTPSYPVGCKRLCVVDEYWPCFNRPNVHLVVTGKGGVSHVSERGPVMGDGTEHSVDVLLLATGYKGFSVEAMFKTDDDDDDVCTVFSDTDNTTNGDDSKSGDGGGGTRG